MGLFADVIADEETAAVAKHKPPIMAPKEDVLHVFLHWRTYHPRSYPRPIDTMKEWQKIAARLREGYTVEQLRQAIDGMHKSPFHQGENDRQTKYLSLELCLRDASKVEQFLRLDEQYDAAYGSAPVLSEKTQKTLRAGQNWLNRNSGGSEASGPALPPEPRIQETRRLTDDRH